jgi:hypothetical protein
MSRANTWYIVCSKKGSRFRAGKHYRTLYLNFCWLPFYKLEVFFELFYSIKQGNEYMYNNDENFLSTFSHTTLSILQSRVIAVSIFSAHIDDDINHIGKIRLASHSFLQRSDTHFSLLFLHLSPRKLLNAEHGARLPRKIRQTRSILLKTFGIILNYFFRKECFNSVSNFTFMKNI